MRRMTLLKDARAKRSDRIAGMLMGGAIGDALGSAFEFLSSDTIERHLGRSSVKDFEPAAAGSLLYKRSPGQPTDDTAMALSVASAVISYNDLTADVFAARFLEDLDYERGRFGQMFWHGGPGGATTRALSRLECGMNAANNGQVDDGGNGAAMRAHPAGCLRDRDEALRVAAVQAKVTHGHPAAVTAAQAVAALVFDAIAGNPASHNMPAGIDDPIFRAAWQDAHRNLTRGERLPEHLRDAEMSGWATVATAHAITLVYEDDPEHAIGAAAASGGDTDTVASIVGALVGARYGASALPRRWIDGLAYGTTNFWTSMATKLARL